MDVTRRLRTCAERWCLRPGGRLTGGYRSEVVECLTADGTGVVLKLTATVREARVEAAALAAWAGTGAAVRLLDSDLDQGALLLERVRPGTDLSAVDEHSATEVAAGVLARLHSAAPSGYPFPTPLDTYAWMDRVARQDADYEQRSRGEPDRGRVALERLPAARAAATRLCASAGRTVLLHGDFLDKNLLDAGTGYLAVDPVPHVGDPCADVGFFAAGRPPVGTTLSRATTIATQLGLDDERARRWAAVWTVVQACQAWRGDQAELESYVSGGEVDALLAG